MFPVTPAVSFQANRSGKLMWIMWSSFRSERDIFTIPESESDANALHRDVAGLIWWRREQLFRIQAFTYVHRPLYGFISRSGILASYMHVLLVPTSGDSLGIHSNISCSLLAKTYELSPFRFWLCMLGCPTSVRVHCHHSDVRSSIGKCLFK